MASTLTMLREAWNDPCWGPPAPQWLPDTHMPSLSGKIAILTGPTAGIGLETARQLVLSGAKVYLFGRNPDKLATVRARLQAECDATLAGLPPSDGRSGGKAGEMVVVQCDLASVASVRRAVAEFGQHEERCDLVFGNAGVVAMGKTEEGFELMWGTNTLGHHVLLRLLMPYIQRAAEGGKRGETRIVLTASGAHRFVDQKVHVSPEGLEDYRTVGLRTQMQVYGRSKMGNIYTAQKLAELCGAKGWDVVAASVHPGAIQSDLGAKGRAMTWFKKVMMYPATLGAVTQLWAGMGAKADEVNGKYCVPWARVGELNELGRDKEARDAVWRWCEEQCVKLGVVDEMWLE